MRIPYLPGEKWAAAERAALCDLLDQVGPDAPTLCAGWAAADLAAHLVVRETRPDAQLGLVVSALHDHTARVERSVRDATAYPELVRRLRSGPPPWTPLGLPLLREQVNLGEFFVHHEDVRRAGDDSSPRELPSGMVDALWRRLRLAAPGLFRHAVRRGLRVVLQTSDGRSRRVGRGQEQVTLTGAVPELVLYAFDRRGVAEVEVGGSDQARAALDEASLGL